MTDQSRFSRRRFLRRAVAASSAVVLPTMIPAGVLAAPDRAGANERFGIGFIGAGGRARQLMDHLPQQGRIVAVCDCFLPRAHEAVQQKKADWPVYQDYNEVLGRKDVDAVVVPTTDHTRVRICVHACQAGKDVYAEKPLTLTIAEGRTLVRAARKHGCVFQVGSQQRTMEMNRFACELVRSGGIGKVHTVLGINYPGPGRYTGLPEQPTPAGLDWDAWCGQAPLRPYNAQLQFGWMGWRSYSGGEMTNWGAHGLDQVQWALGMSESGPVEIWPVSPGGNGKVSMRYASGVVVRLELSQGPHGGAIFVGDGGKIEINRNKFTTNPPDLVKNPPQPATAEIWEGPGWIARPHMQNWFDCIKSRRRPNADVEIGHRSISVCHLANIAREAGRRLRWNPAAERFIDDDAANALLDRPKRAGYELPEIG